MSPLKEILVSEEIVPPEARSIAEAFRREARRVRELAAQSRNTKGSLDQSWEGNSKNKFIGAFDPQINQLDNYANSLEEKARHIENIRVTVWKKKMIYVRK